MSVSTLLEQTAVYASAIASAKAAIRTSIEAKGVSVPSGTALSALPSYVSAIETGGGGGDIDALIEGTISSITSPVSKIADYKFNRIDFLTYASFPNCKSIGVSAFYFDDALSSIYFPVCETIGSSAFGYCKSLITASFPNCKSIYEGAFREASELTTIYFPNVSVISTNAFNGCQKLQVASFPNCTSVESSAFNFCTKLQVASFPNCSVIGSSAFKSDVQLSSIYFPKCKSIWSGAFSDCYLLTEAAFPACTFIASSAFAFCSRLSILYLMGSSVASLTTSWAFYGTLLSGSRGSIIVPMSLVDTYKGATNWRYFSSIIFGA